MKHTLAFVDSISQNISEAYYLAICNALKKDYDENQKQNPDEIALDMITDVTLRLSLAVRDNNKKELDGKVKGFYDALDFMFVEPADREEFFIDYLEKLCLSPSVINKFVKKYF